MASEITFVNEDNIEFLSSVSLSSLKQAFAQNFIHSDSESGESSSSDGSCNDFSDKSSSEEASEMSSYEESLKGSSSNKKKVFRKKRTASVGGNKPEDGPRSKKKTTSNKYISVEEGERIKETLKTFIKSVHTHCEKKLRDDKSLSIFLVRKQFVHFIQNIEPSCTLFGNVCREMLSEIISKFTEVAGMKVKNCEKRASFSIQCSRVLLDVEKTNNWKEIRDAFAATLEEKERHEVYLHASVVLNVTYWTIHEKFHEMVLQIKIDKAKSQSISDESQDAVVASDIVDVARISGAALHQLRKGREKVIFGRKGARKLSESTKENYAKEMKLMTEMVCSEEEKKSLPLGLKTLDEGKLTFPNTKFNVVFLALDSRIRELLSEANLKRYPKHLMKLTKQAVSLDEELWESFLVTAKAVCKAQPDSTRLRAIWRDLVKKICHTKFKEFYAAQEEKALMAAGKVVSADQSLRDKLKTYSIDKRLM